VEERPFEGHVERRKINMGLQPRRFGIKGFQREGARFTGASTTS
jgi:hypothetical protein